MAADMRRFLDGLNREAGATDTAIAESENRLRRKLPTEYIDFLKLTNGGEGFVGKNSYVMLWPIGDLPSMNQSYEVEKYVPGLVIFGSDGGGEAYGFDTRSAEWPIVQVPFVGMAWSVAQPMGASFHDFLERLYKSDR